jgi:Arc/MetJ-type ribon-helix-helix transcriptional regulator
MDNYPNNLPNEPDDVCPVQKAIRVMFADGKLDYGVVLPHEYLHDILGLTPPEFGSRDDFKKHALRALQRMETLKQRLLEEHQRYLQSVRGTGYRVCLPAEQTDTVYEKGMSQMKSALHQLQRGLENVNHAMLTERERAHNVDTRVRVAEMSQFTQRREVEQRRRRRLLDAS